MRYGGSLADNHWCFPDRQQSKPAQKRRFFTGKFLNNFSGSQLYTSNIAQYIYGFHSRWYEPEAEMLNSDTKLYISRYSSIARTGTISCNLPETVMRSPLQPERTRYRSYPLGNRLAHQLASLKMRSSAGML